MSSVEAETKPKADRLRPVLGLVAWILLTLTIGMIGGRATAAGIPDWYDKLNRPSLTPPDSVFGPVWTVLYLMMAVAIWLVWLRQGDSKAGRTAASLYMLQLFLNGLWSVVFFGSQSPAGGMLVILLLWFAILWTLVVFWKQRLVSGVLLIPYLAWVSFAAVLNYQVWVLNP